MTNKKQTVRKWLDNYIQAQHVALDSINFDTIEQVITTIHEVHSNGGRIFVCGNGGNAANASHFATDLGKNGSEGLDSPFKILSINDNVSWVTAIGNDFSFADVFTRQIQCYASSKDLLIVSSVSGNSPNLVKVVKWASQRGLKTVAFVGQGRGQLAELCDTCIIIDDAHYGRVEDIQMSIFHILTYAFAENVDASRDRLNEEMKPLSTC